MIGLKLKGKSLVKSILIVSSGTAIAQVITMAFSPIITRIYGPEAFGVLGVFMSVVSIIAPIAAFTYPVAIVLPKKDEEARSLAILSVILAILVSIVSLLVILIINENFIAIFNLATISNFIFLIPFVILFSAILQVSQQWLLRKKSYKHIANATMMHSLILNSSKVGLGYFYPVASMLIVISVIGNLMFTLLLWTKKPAFKLGKIKWDQLLKVAKEYKDFPIYRSPQVFVNAFSQGLPILLLSILYTPAAAGFYSLARNVLNVPIALIGKSVGDVIYPRFAEIHNKGEKIQPLLLKSTIYLALIGLVPFGIVIAFGPMLFSFIFGQEWVIAGEYARWLSLWLYFMFINRPSVVAIPVLSLQGRFLTYEVITTIIKGLTLVISISLFNINDVFSIALYSVVGVLAYLYLILRVIQQSK